MRSLLLFDLSYSPDLALTLMDDECSVVQALEEQERMHTHTRVAKVLK